MKKIIGITGGIASGKSYIANMFNILNIPVFNADEAIKQIYLVKHIYNQVKLAFPKAIREGKIDGKILGDIVFANFKKLNILESILYPELNKQLNKFMAQDVKYLVIDMPLLFEKNYNQYCNYIITIYCPVYIQKIRALKRKNMSNSKLENIINNQFKSLVKRNMSDYNIYSGKSYNYTDWQFVKIIKDIYARDNI